MAAPSAAPSVRCDGERVLEAPWLRNPASRRATTRTAVNSYQEQPGERRRCRPRHYGCRLRRGAPWRCRLRRDAPRRRGLGPRVRGDDSGFSAPSAAAPRATTATTPTAPSVRASTARAISGRPRGRGPERASGPSRARRRALLPPPKTSTATRATRPRRPCRSRRSRRPATSRARAPTACCPGRRSRARWSSSRAARPASRLGPGPPDQVLVQVPGPSGARVGARALRCRCIYARVSP